LNELSNPLQIWYRDGGWTTPGGGAVGIPTLPIPTVLSSYSRIAGLGWEPGYAVSYVSRDGGRTLAA